MMLYTVYIYIYYSKHETSDVEHFEIPCNYGYGKGMIVERRPLLPLPSPTKARYTM